MPSAGSPTCILHHQLDKATHYWAEKCQETTSASFTAQPVFELARSEMDQLLRPELKQFNFYLIAIDQSSASYVNSNNSWQMFDVFSDKEGCHICGRRRAAQVVLEIALGNLFHKSLIECTFENVISSQHEPIILRSCTNAMCLHRTDVQFARSI